MSRIVALAGKRAFDLVTAVVLTSVCAVPMAVVALAIKLESPGPVFFRQERVGRGGRTFLIFKFRSMARDADRAGPVMTMEDPRITRVGGILRRTSLDELPQLLNVLRGEMSLVGPRPLLPGTIRPGEERRLLMRPGMTSLVEVSRPHVLSWDERMRLDVEYVDRWSFALDLSVLLRTIPVLFVRKDILDLPRSSSDATEEGSGP